MLLSCNVPYYILSRRNSDDHEAIDRTLKFFFNGTHVRTLLLHKYASAIHLNGELYGSLDSLHSSSALVCAHPPSSVRKAIPGFTIRYLFCTVLLKVGDSAAKQLWQTLFG